MAALGGLLFGYDWVVIGGAKPFFEPFFEIHGSPERCGIASSRAGPIARPGGMPLRGTGSRGLERSLRAEMAADDLGHDLRRHVDRQCPGAEFRGLRPLADPGRHSDRPGLQPFAGLYLGSRPCGHARQAGFHQPTHNRDWSASGPDDELVAGQRPAGGRRDDRLRQDGDDTQPSVLLDLLAVDVRPDCGAFRLFFPGHVLRAGKSAPAAQAAARKGGGRDFAADRRRELRTGRPGGDRRHAGQ